MPPLDTLRTWLIGLPPELRIAGSVAVALILLLALALLSTRRRLSAERRAVEVLRAGRADLLQQAALADERLRQRDDRLAALATVETDRLAAVTEAATLRETVRQQRDAADRLQQRLDGLGTALDTLRGQHGDLHSAHSALISEHAEKFASKDREVRALTDLRDEMTLKFDDIANTALRRTGAEFQKSHSDKLTELLTPFREHVGRFEEELRAVHKSADGERVRLAEQIRLLTTQTEAVSAEAVNLTRALKGDKQKQGAWGEMILERLLEDSGLVAGTHYDRQASRTGEDGRRWRPDVVVRLPQQRSLVIDSKVSLVAYEAASSASDDDTRRAHLKSHARSLRSHIDTLSDKAYTLLDAGSVDYVLMFVPIEGALSEAWRVADDLASYAAVRRVGLVTPTTLMLALRTVDHIWTVEKREKNAELIAARAGHLYDKFAGFVDDVEKVGRALGQAGQAHDAAMGKLTRGSGNLVGQAEKLRALGAKATKSLTLVHDGDDDDQDAARLPVDAAE